ncbi:ABC transporter [Lactobacillus mulieris]|uniref:ABC transporter n=1 Tax=Lactobacillus mulieris TaxID=2508708 RepID=A0AAW5WXT0_9LACO|nr:ABC transporter [Lactobacillus mulieris]MCZ3621622.1 ABC transporter [Lactobacillus mulieris]MCZ3623102.1 ABC transporter [Lactobacillus mulieris]MCZ3635629.1 ABC transporter [Lactobacillus mulieris]MCZ3690646.1 ABC transporter [Lactobacillus mulieris]MCZ3696606.1 ABC transporter [Lactobacillus mulieris]
MEDSDKEWIHEIYTDCEEGMIIIDKENKTGDITSFTLTSKQLNVKQETVEFWIYYTILTLMKTNPGINEFYWINVKLDKD